MAPLFIECGMVPLCAGDQTIYFQTALRCSVKLVLHSLNRSCRRLVVCCTSATQQGFPTNVDCDIGNDESMWVCRGEADLFGALHVVFDKNSPIYSFCREPNTAAHDLARALREECLALWRDGGGPQKCLALLDAAPCPSLMSVVQLIDTEAFDSVDCSHILDKIAVRMEKTSDKDILAACTACRELITHFSVKNQRVGTSRLLLDFAKSDGLPSEDVRKQFIQRLSLAAKQLVLHGIKSSVFEHKMEAVGHVAWVIEHQKKSKEPAMCSWLEEHEVLEELFGERAHASIIPHTVDILGLIELTDSRVNMLLDAALLHSKSLRAQVHRVILHVLPKLTERAALIVLDRILQEVSDNLPAVLTGKQGIKIVTDGHPSSPAFLRAQSSGNCQRAAFELVTVMFDTSDLSSLSDTLCIMKLGDRVSSRALDVLIAALLTPICKDQEVINKLIRGSLFHCLQSTWGESYNRTEQNKMYVARLCCKVLQNSCPPQHALAFAMGTHKRLGASCGQYGEMPSELVQQVVGTTSQMVVSGAFAVLVETLRLFPRCNFKGPAELTREECIYALQKQFDVLSAGILNAGSLSQSLDERVMENDDVLQTELWARLEQLRYLLENTGMERETNSLMLDKKQVDHLWEALNGSTECCLRWLRWASDSGGILHEATQEYLFRKYICQMDPATLKPHGFNCFQAFFADVNSSSEAWTISGRSGQKSGCKINGPAFVGRRVRALWKDEKMHNGTICSYSPPTQRDPVVLRQRHTVRWDDTGKEETHDWTDLHDWHLLEDELSVNITAYEIVNIPEPHCLEGLDFLWGACLLATDDTVATKAQDMMLHLSCHMPDTFQKGLLARLSDEMQKAAQLNTSLEEAYAALPDAFRRTRMLRVRQFMWKFITWRLKDTIAALGFRL